MEWISVDERLPKEFGYYNVRFDDGSEDEKPFRIIPSKNIYGFMTEKTVVEWSIINESEYQ